MLEKLKNTGVDNMAVEELICLMAFGRSFQVTGASYGYAPEWVEQRLKSIDRELKTRMADTVEKELAAAQAQYAALTPAEDKRKALLEKIAGLKAQLQTA